MNSGKNIRVISVIIILGVIVFSGCRKGNVPVPVTETIRDHGGGTGTTTWTKDKNYILDGLVFVNEGQVLTIEAGTVIRGRTGQGEYASALIVARGGKIIARGTRTEPIIFTVEGDDLAGSVPAGAKGLWGGLILLGRAHLNIPHGETHIEGITPTEDRGVYGGVLDDDNSGTLEYVSIRHGGTNIGQGNEINGLTLGGVGSSTKIEHIEVISNLDDGVECFGGCVNLRYVVVAYCGDDGLDVDYGYHGKIQFFLVVQSSETGDKLIEATGNEGVGYGLPYTLPVVENFTGIGRGFNTGAKVATFSLNSAGKIFNSVFADQDLGITIEYTNYDQDSYKHLSRNNLALESNIFRNIAGNDTSQIFSIEAEEGLDITGPQNTLAQYFHSANNEISDIGVGLYSGSFHIKPAVHDFNNPGPYPDDWFTPVSYKGAFLDDNWIEGWTLLYADGKIVF